MTIHKIAGYTIEQTDTEFHVYDDEHRRMLGNDAAPILSYEYGPGWLGCSETGNVHKTTDPLASIVSVLDNVDVNGYPDIEDDANRCVVCDEPSEWHWCSTDCFLQDRDSTDNH